MFFSQIKHESYLSDTQTTVYVQKNHCRYSLCHFDGTERISAPYNTISLDDNLLNTAVIAGKYVLCQKISAKNCTQSIDYHITVLSFNNEIRIELGASTIEV